MVRRRKKIYRHLWNFSSDLHTCERLPTFSWTLSFTRFTYIYKFGL